MGWIERQRPDAKFRPEDRGNADAYMGNCSRPLAGLLRVGGDGMVDGGLAA